MNTLKTVFEIFESLGKIDEQRNNIKPTFLYDEGWMLRLILNWFSKNKTIGFPLSMKENAHWYSEGLLSTKFKAVYQGDKLAEKHTHADGVFGDICIGNTGKEDVSIISDCKQFIVVEAKMYSKYSKGTTNAPNYNQAARIIACMCDIITNNKQNVKDMGFYTLLPEEQIKKQTAFQTQIDINNVKKVILDRITQYKKGRDDYEDKKQWYDNAFIPFCDLIKTKLISWEETIEFIKSKDKVFGDSLDDFYAQCKKYNK